MVRVFLTHPPETLAKYYGQRALAALAEMVEVRTNPHHRVLDAQELTEQIRGCAIVISDRQTPGYAELFAHSPDLAAWLRCAVDIRNIDVEAASSAGILVAHATPGFGTAVAELALGLMIDLGRNISSSVVAYRSGGTPPAPMGRQLQGSTLGIIGYGEIGIRLAAFGHALGMIVLVADPYKTVEAPGVRQVAMGELLAQSDFVVCLAVATPETVNLMGRDAFFQMRNDAFFVNLSRGELVDEAALAAALDAGEIAGAAMDVGRAPDQMPNPDLASRQDVVATPHLAGLTPAAIEHQAFDTVEQVRALLSGTMPAQAVNRDRVTRLARLATT